MKKTLFIPEKMKVGFQIRNGTYTGKLAYITYYDNKGKLRKEHSWNGWRNKKIAPEDFDNIPTEGFVLNKKAGDYETHWHKRSAVIRVYDPRGYEFEVKVDNLLYILENTSCIKGKGLEGEFVYALDGKDLILIPVGSVDYKELKRYNKLLRKENYTMKDVVVGGTYLNKGMQEEVYLGRFMEYVFKTPTYDTLENIGCIKSSEKHKSYFFYNIKNDQIVTYRTLGGYIIDTVTDDKHIAIADFLDILECDSRYSKYDNSLNEFVADDGLIKPKLGSDYYKRSNYKGRDSILIRDRDNNVERYIRMEIYESSEYKYYWIPKSDYDNIRSKSSPFSYGDGHYSKKLLLNELSCNIISRSQNIGDVIKQISEIGYERVALLLKGENGKTIYKVYG